jgi:hypothetical protein
VGPEILGTPLPGTAIEWIGLLVAIVAALLTVLSAIEKFVELLGLPVTALRPYGGLALPVGWAFWCAVLLLGRHDVVAVLVVLIGTFVITATGRVLVQKCKA